MSLGLDPDELAIREAFDRRRPVAVPPELLARVAAVPREIKPLRPMPVRVALGVAPWLAVAAAAVVLAFGPRFVASLPGPVAAPGEPAGPAWSPATTGGVAEIGLFGLPWVPFLVSLALVGGIATVVHVRGGGTMPDRATVGRTVRKYASSWLGEWTPRQQVLLVAIWLVPFTVVQLAQPRDPFRIGSAAAPGPAVAEIRSDGWWYDDESEEWVAPDPCLETAPRCPGPRWVYRVGPGEPYTYVASVRNGGLLPVTLLGRSPLRQPSGPHGLGLLRDPSNPSADPANVVPFHPVTLWPGQELALVFVDAGETCADPAAVLRDRAGSQVGGRSLPPLIYDAFGWRSSTYVFPKFEVTVAGCDEPG